MDTESQDPSPGPVVTVSILTSELLDGIKGLDVEVDLPQQNENEQSLPLNPEEKSLRIHELVQNHLRKCYQFSEPGSGTANVTGAKNLVHISLDDPSCEWIRTASAPAPTQPKDILNHFSNSILILEFFTYCCINCIHSIEDVREVYETLQNQGSSCQVKLISVHSPKFTREKQNDSIQAFVQRMKMDHSLVLNDPNSTLWTELGIYCWPTLLIFGPKLKTDAHNPKSRNLLFALMGEGQKETLKLLLENSVQFLSSLFPKEFFNSSESELLLSIENLNLEISSKEDEETLLRYPGKITIQGNLLAIADSGHNRILVCEVKTGKILHIIGTGTKGLADGDFRNAQFYNPQGLAFGPDQKNPKLYVADTGNHSIRSIDLDSKKVTTLVPKLAEIIGPAPDNESKINLKSPWDLVFYDSECLLVAAAGNHQIFGYFFDDKLLFGTQHTPNSFDLIAGTGKEENRNNTYILKSSFAQPSGISVANKSIFIADSESSSIRQINPEGRVMGLVGGNRDPNDLFSYGDIDGCFYDAKLQHPVGICSTTSDSPTSRLFVADTFNHKIKMVDVNPKHCTTLVGTGVPGNSVGDFTGLLNPKKLKSRSSSKERSDEYSKSTIFALLNEPSGICIDQESELLYIADTNNHSIKVANLQSAKVTEFKLHLDSDSIDSKAKPSRQTKIDRSFESQIPKSLNPETRDMTSTQIQLKITNLPPHIENIGWKILESNGLIVSPIIGEIRDQETVDDVENSQIQNRTIPLEVSWNNNSPNGDSGIIGEFQIQVHIYFCGDLACIRKSLVFSVKLRKSEELELEMEMATNNSSISLEYQYLSKS